MLRKTFVVVCVVAVAGLACPAMAGDCAGCKKIADSGEGFCGDCSKGLAFGVKMASKALYGAMMGISMDLDKVKCPGCKSAAATNGRCEHCNVGIAGGKAYSSPTAHALAKGMLVSEKQAAHCEGCKTAYKTNGFCTKCNAGIVAGWMFKDQPSHQAALAAHQTLVRAAKTAAKCDTCAVAMVTDGTCKQCKVSFKAGKPKTM